MDATATERAVTVPSEPRINAGLMIEVLTPDKSPTLVIDLVILQANSTRLDSVPVAGFVRERNRSHVIRWQAIDDTIDNAVVVVASRILNWRTAEFVV